MIGVNVVFGRECLLGLGIVIWFGAKGNSHDGRIEIAWK